MVISYITLGVNDLPRAQAFYDVVLGELGAKRIMEMERGTCWGTGFDKPVLSVMKPYDGKAATHGVYAA